MEITFAMEKNLDERNIVDVPFIRDGKTVGIITEYNSVTGVSVVLITDELYFADVINTSKTIGISSKYR